MASPPIQQQQSETRSQGTNRPLKDRKMSLVGYSSNIFEGKPEQMKQVANYISSKGFLPNELIEQEVTWFYKYHIFKLFYY